MTACVQRRSIGPCDPLDRSPIMPHTRTPSLSKSPSAVCARLAHGLSLARALEGTHRLAQLQVVVQGFPDLFVMLYFMSLQEPMDQAAIGLAICMVQ